jgi:hypothetical protein
MPSRRVKHQDTTYDIRSYDRFSKAQLYSVFKQASLLPVVGHAHCRRHQHIDYYLAFNNGEVIEIAKRRHGFKPQTINSDIVWPLLKGNFEMTPTIEEYDNLPPLMKSEIAHIVVLAIDLPAQALRLFKGETPKNDDVFILTYRDKKTRERKEIFYVDKEKVTKRKLLSLFGIDFPESAPGRRFRRRDFFGYALLQPSPKP